MPQAEILSLEHFVPDAVAFIEQAATEAIASRGEFRLSLSGGGTPAPVYAALAKRPLDWNQVIVTFGDERMVPADHEESNFRMARETLLGQIDIPEANVLRMRGELDPAEAAKAYEQALREKAGPEGIFRHDLILLGLGGDGHTASLFPESKGLTEQDRWVIPNFVEKFDTWRLTFTYPLLNAARAVAFLLRGDGKKEVAEEVRQGQNNHPAIGVQPTDGRLFWLMGN
ncbi:MAG: 6-phosphogluconolactonase [Verrucomicrobiota bacterium]